MVNLTKEQKLQKEQSIRENTAYAVDFLKWKIRNATVLEKNGGPLTFRFTEFANYIVENSPEYRKMWQATRNDITGQLMAKSYFINTHRVRLGHLLDQLIIKKYVTLAGVVHSHRNPEVSTRLYSIDVWDIRE